MRAPEELRALAESYLGDLALTPELYGQTEAVRYALAAGGKRVRPVICLATVEAAGAEAEAALPAAAALELVHNFSLVHDDLPALDDDVERRGQPSVWARYGEAVAILAGDALLAEAFRLACSYRTAVVERGLAESRAQAQALVLAGRVRGYDKPGHQVDEDAELDVAAPPPYVSRGGEKLAHALDAFGVDPAGRDCLDVGASTGGLTDVLLQRGAARVVALDVGYGQL